MYAGIHGQEAAGHNSKVTATENRPSFVQGTSLSALCAVIDGSCAAAGWAAGKGELIAARLVPERPCTPSAAFQLADH